METFGKICFAAVAVILSSVLGGYVFMKLWEWFVVYAFAVKPLTLIQAIGLMFVWGYLKHKSKKDEDVTWEDFAREVFSTLILMCMVLGIGYLITLFQ